MRIKLVEPRMVAEAREQIRFKRSNIPAPLDLMLELLIFVAVFFVAQIVISSLLALVLMIPAVLLNPNLMQQLAGAMSDPGGFDAAYDKAMDAVLASPTMALVSLLATAGSITGVFIYCRAIERRKLSTLGLRRGHILREYLVGLVIGFGLFALALLIAVLSGSVSYLGLGGAPVLLLLLFLVGFMIQGMSEELLCRGYLMLSLARRQNLALAVVVSSAVFGLMHLPNSNVTWLAILNIVLFGCLMGFYILKRGDIWGAGAIHTAWNFSQGNLFGISVSGMEPMPSLLNFASTDSSNLISGGAFGIEGGLAATIVLVLGTAAVLFLKNLEAARPPSPSPPSPLQTNGL